MTTAKSYKIINTGICILRLWMCLEVVMNHCYVSANDFFVVNWLHPVFGRAAVPIFFIISFYYLDPEALSEHTDRFKSRLLRLVIPQVTWGGIYWIIVYVVDKIWNLYQDEVTPFDLIAQIFTGSVAILNPVMWFQVDLIIATVLVFSLYKIKSNAKGRLLSFLFIVCFVVQYTGINYDIFQDCGYELIPVARLAEIIPYCIAGLFLAKNSEKNGIETIRGHKKIENRFLKGKWIYILLCAAMVIAFILLYDTDDNVVDFGYSGIPLLFFSVILFVLFRNTKSRIQSVRLKKMIYGLGKSTETVYFSHILIRNVIAVFFDIGSIKGVGSFWICISIMSIGIASHFILFFLKNCVRGYFK